MWVDFVFFRSTSSDENSEFNFQAYRNIEKVLKNPGSLHPSFTNFSCLLYLRVSTPQQRNVKLLSSTIPNSFNIFFFEIWSSKKKSGTARIKAFRPACPGFTQNLLKYRWEELKNKVHISGNSVCTYARFWTTNAYPRIKMCVSSKLAFA